ncbi:MAG: Kdo hydroxylase family protein [Acidobacteria bacterium]|nr:Kdo hydroxylase family protein [Acidobacteriota bacterium]
MTAPANSPSLLNPRAPCEVAPLIAVEDFGPEWSPGRAAQACLELERGGILKFSGVPFELPQADIAFLLSYAARDSRFHKNVSYRPASGVLRGFAGDPASEERTQCILRTYSQNVVAFAAKLLAPYAGRWTLDFASFRPLEEAGRSLSLHKRNDLLHVDAFPSRPTRGARILRVFTNLNPAEPRVWNAGLAFPRLAEQYAAAAGLSRFSAPGPLRRISRSLALRSSRSPYDSFMLHFHDWMKENASLQSGLPRRQVEFPPSSTWLVFTDGVPHAVMSGRFALEQTIIVPAQAMVAPELAPIRVLERLAGTKLA